MKNKLKTFSVTRRTIIVETVNVKAKDKQSLWDKMENRELVQGKPYNWQFVESSSISDAVSKD